MDILSRGLANRPFKEICAERALIESLYTDLARTPLNYTDLVQRPGEESSDLAQRSFIESLNRDLT